MRKHMREMYNLVNPILYRKTGVYRGIPNFLIFLAEAALTCTHDVCFEQKY